MKFELIDKQDRRKLHEGRNYGVSFTFLKRDGNTLTTVSPLSPCKDYLNDWIWSHHRKKDYRIYGCHSSYVDLFKDNCGYLLIGVLKRGCRDELEYDNYKRDLETLNDNYKNLQLFINQFEKRLKVKERTKLIKLGDNRILAIVPMFWCKFTYSISLYSFLLRIGIFYKNGDIMRYYKKFSYDHSDVYMINSIKPKLERMLGGEIPHQDLSTISNPHDLGICSFMWPEKIVKPLILKPQILENIW